MSCNSTYFLLLHGSLIKLLILSMSSVWKKEVNNAFAHQEYDYTCDCAYPGKQQKILRDRVKRNNGISYIVKPTCTTKIIHYIESYFKTKTTMFIIFNLQNSHLLTFSLSTEKVFEVKSASGKSSSCRFSFSAARDANTKAVTFGFSFCISVLPPSRKVWT